MVFVRVTICLFIHLFVCVYVYVCLILCVRACVHTCMFVFMFMFLSFREYKSMRALTIHISAKCQHDNVDAVEVCSEGISTLERDKTALPQPMPVREPI